MKKYRKFKKVAFATFLNRKNSIISNRKNNKTKKWSINMTLDELKERLDDEFQDIYKCILINGDWGIGKTFFLKEKFLKDKDYIDVSVFGAKSIEAIKAEIYSKINTKC